MESIKEIHQRAVHCAKKFHLAEAELLFVLQQVDTHKVFRHLGYTSLFEYATKALSLSESHAYAFITVSRKSLEVPALHAAISEGTLSVSKAKLATVIAKERSD